MITKRSGFLKHWNERPKNRVEGILNNQDKREKTRQQGNNRSRWFKGSEWVQPTSCVQPCRDPAYTLCSGSVAELSVPCQEASGLVRASAAGSQRPQGPVPLVEVVRLRRKAQVVEAKQVRWEGSRCGPQGLPRQSSEKALEVDSVFGSKIYKTKCAM